MSRIPMLPRAALLFALGITSAIGGSTVIALEASVAQTPTRASLDAASREFDDAQQRRDVAALTRWLAPDLVYISGSGRIGGKDTFIAGFSGPDTRFDPFDIRERRVVLLSPDVGVVTAEGRISGSEAGAPFTEHFRYSDTFAWRDGRWVVVYVQVTKLPE